MPASAGILVRNISPRMRDAVSIASSTLSRTAPFGVSMTTMDRGSDPCSGAAASDKYATAAAAANRSRRMTIPENALTRQHYQTGNADQAVRRITGLPEL